MAARFFQGFGVSPAATVGMAVGEASVPPFDSPAANGDFPVGDLFFEHERGQKLGLWVLALDTGLLAGPICKLITPSRHTRAASQLSPHNNG